MKKTLSTFMQALKRVALIVSMAYVAICGVMFCFQRSLLYFPTHQAANGTLIEWSKDGKLMGYCRKVENPDTVWFMLHGNGGQASDRDYVLKRLAPNDSLYVLEYPGYGSRDGAPNRTAFDLAAREAYEHLTRQYPDKSIGVIGESLGSGPACSLANASRRPDKIVLVVPFDSLYRVAAERFFFLPVRLLLLDQWNNVETLARYEGPIEIFAARNDLVIPPSHARALADQIPSAQLQMIPGGHNDWAQCSEVQIKL